MGQQFTVTLSDDLAEMVQAKVRSGEYASVDEVIGEALALSDGRAPYADEEVERWLRTDVVETLRRMKNDPSPGRTPEQVRISIEKEYQRIVAGRI